MSFFVYILKCKDDTLYVGSTNDLERRLHQHNHLKSGAHYTKIRRPVEIVYSKKLKNLSAARKKEHVFKQLSRKEKLSLIEKAIKKAPSSSECPRGPHLRGF